MGSNTSSPFLWPAVSYIVLAGAIDLVGWGIIVTVATDSGAENLLTGAGLVALVVVNVFVLFWAIDRLVRNRLAIESGGT